MFSKLKNIKTNCWSRLTEIRLDSLLIIAEDDPKFGDYDIISAISLWAKDKIQRPNQAERGMYKQQKSNKPKIVSLSDSDGLFFMLLDCADRKMPPGKLPPEIFPPGKLPPRKLPPPLLSPTMKFFCEFLLISNFYFYDKFRP